MQQTNKHKNQGWCGILIFDKYTYLASFWYLSLYKYPKYTYEHPKYTYYQNILMKRVSVQKYPKGGPLGIKCKLFINISFYLRRSYGTIRMSIGDIRMLEKEKISRYPTFVEIPLPDWISQKHIIILNFGRFRGQIYLFQASKYTYRGQKYTDDKLYLWSQNLPHHPWACN